MQIPLFLIWLLPALLALTISAPLYADNSGSENPVTLFNRWFSLPEQHAVTEPEKKGDGKVADKTLKTVKTIKAVNNKDKDTLPDRSHPVDVFELPEVEVVSTTPLGTTGLAFKKIPGNVQSSEDEDINRHEAFGLTDFMNRRLESVNINDTQNNPYQPDITYRGFTASPLLGTPIGLSVYQDGVRVNEAFGDTVNWDLIPQVAIASMEMMPGSNPLYGLNTLGGALSVKTKSGFSNPGFRTQASGGSYGRQAYTAEYGGFKDNFDWYFAGNIFDDNGWRPYSPTSVNQAFGKVGWENEKTDIDLSFTFADNNLQGVGPTPQNMLQQNWSSVYTSPDVTKNTMYFFNLKGSHKITDQLQLSGNTYNRNNNSSSVNSNTNESCVKWVSGTECLDSDGASQIPASFQATRAQQNGTGVNLQLTSDYKVLAHDNQLSVGGGYNYSKSQFSVASQDAIFTTNNYEIATQPLSTTVLINGQNAYSNIFATNTFSFYSWLHANSSLNWARAEVQTFDQLNVSTSINSLSGSNVFQRVNPSAGLTFQPLDAFSLETPLKELTTYFNYNEGFRAPTAVETSCANPDAPCTLPSSMVSDPPLKAVVSHTLEVGARGKFNQGLKWNIALYQTRNTNDILFLNSPGSVINGYFANVGATLRQGVELGLSGLAWDKLNWYASYGFVDATYQTTATLSNSLGSETVTLGSRIPSIPQSTFKVGGEYEVFHNWFLGSDLQYVASQFARGDDSNLYPQIPNYTLLNINARYVVTKNIELYATGRNVLDNHYASFGQLGQNFFQNNASTTFMGPGAPATGYAGVRLHWD
jgi:iron complex outermembrane recepter protein